MNRYVRPLAVAMMLAMLAPGAAVAAPSFRMSTSQKIDFVRDLPNDAVYERDGQYYDLGYLYSTERVNGADVATGGGGFVLYHDDQYVQLDAGKLSMITGELGEDPTEGYIPPAGSRSTSRTSSGSDSDAAPSGFATPSSSSGMPYKPAARSSAVGALGWIVPITGFIFIVMIRLGMSWILRGFLGAIFGGFSGRRRRERSWSASEGDGLFEARVAAQMAALQAAQNMGSNAQPAGDPWQAQPMAPPAPRGFGRKGV